MPVPTPAEAEERLRRLLAKHGLPPPDEVRHRPGEVVLLYHEQELAFVFELSHPWPEDDDDTDDEDLPRERRCKGRD